MAPDINNTIIAAPVALVALVAPGTSLSAIGSLMPTLSVFLFTDHYSRISTLFFSIPRIWIQPQQIM